MPSRWFKKKSSSMPDFFHEGSVQVDSHLKELEKCTARVESITIYRTPLQEGALPALAIVNHHFLKVKVTTISHPTQGDMYGFPIRAEKSGRDERGEKTGIIVKLEHVIPEGDYDVKFQANNLHVSIPMDQLLNILTTHSPDYDLVTDNCWRYADATCRALLEAFGDLEPANRSLMRRHLQQMPDLSMPLETLSTVAGYAAVAAASGVAAVVLYKTVSAYLSEGDESEEHGSGKSSGDRVRDDDEELGSE